jgi:glycosyltransferase involved in cell wall biosynthesis
VDLMRLLLIWPYPPWPPVTGTSQRLARLTEQLAARASEGRLEIAIVVTDRQAPEAVPAGISLLAQVPRETGRARSALAVMGALRRGEPLFFAFFRRRAGRAAVADAIATWRPDVVWTHGLAGAAAVDGLVDDSRLVLDLSDAEPDRFARLGKAVGGVRGMVWRTDAARVRKWVGRRLPGLRAVTVVSEADRAIYADAAPAARFVMVPNGVDVGAQPRVDPANGVVMFLGDLGYPPNAEGLGWFVDHVLPRTQALVELKVVGRGSLPMSPGRGFERIRALGFVDDLAGVWPTTTAMVVPIHSGGGSRLKVLDAFGAGIPVVSTTFGMGGIDAVADHDYLRADTAEEFAAALTRLLGDAGLRSRLSANARRLVVARYSWSDCLAPLLAELGA